MNARAVLAIATAAAACGDDGGATPDAPDAPACDLQSDPTCCGAIDHDCLGGACVAGECQPVALAESISAVDLAIAGSSLYFVLPGAGLVERMATDGTGRTTVASTPDSPVAVAATADTVVWATLGALPRDGAIVRLGPGDVTPVPLSTGEHVPCDLALDDAGAVWTNYGSGMAPYVPGELRALSTAGTVATLVPSLNHACGVAVSGGTVYYTTVGTSVVNPTDGTVAQVPRAGGTPLTLASNRRGARFIAVTGSHVYWTDEGSQNTGFTDGRVMRMARTGGLPELLSDETRPHGIVAGADTVYWLAGSTVRRLALGDRTKTTIATLTGRALTVLADDADALYFIAGPDAGSGTGGRIYRLAK